MEGIIKTMSNYGTVIFADMQMNEPKYLCLRDNGELYMCTVEKNRAEFVETNVSELTEQAAMLFVANSTRKAMEAIHSRETQSNKARAD